MSETLQNLVERIDQEQAHGLENLAERINQEHELCRNAFTASVQHALNAGDLLIQAKALCEHGTWGTWLAANCTVSERTAQVYMRMARNREAIEAKAQRVADLSVRGAMLMLAEPRTVDAEQEPADKWDAERAELNRLLQHVQAVLGNASTIQEVAEVVHIAKYCVERAQELWLQSKADYLDALDELRDYLPDKSPFMRLRIDPLGVTFNRRDWKKIDDWVDDFAQAAQERYDQLVREHDEPQIIEEAPIVIHPDAWLNVTEQAV